MNSHARLTYDAVDDYRTGAETEPPAGLDAAILDNLYAAYALLAERRQSRGALELDLPEKRVRFDDAGNAVAITRKRQSVSQKLIEELMILANVCAAETLEGANMLCVFAPMNVPMVTKLTACRIWCGRWGCPSRKDRWSGRTFQPPACRCCQKGDAADLALLNETVLRCQSQADYRITNPGHFGLALRRYAHFTSRSGVSRSDGSPPDHQSAYPGEQGRPDPADAAETASLISQTERQAARRNGARLTGLPPP